MSCKLELLTQFIKHLCGTWQSVLLCSICKGRAILNELVNQMPYDRLLQGI